MKRKFVRIELIPGSQMANCDWLPPIIDGVIQVDQISLAVVMTCLGNPMNIAAADAEIANLPHTIDDFYNNNNPPKPNFDKDNFGLP